MRKRRPWIEADVWAKLPPEEKNRILSKTPSRNINVHELDSGGISYLDSTPRTSDLDDNDGEVFHDAKHPGADYDPGTSTQLLQYVTEQGKLPPWDIRHVLASSRTSPPQQQPNPNQGQSRSVRFQDATYHVNAHVTYHLTVNEHEQTCLLYTSPSPRDGATSRMPSSA